MMGKDGVCGWWGRERTGYVFVYRGGKSEGRREREREEQSDGEVDFGRI